MLPLALSDDQLDTVMRGAAPLPPQDRHKYLERVAELLYQLGGDRRRRAGARLPRGAARVLRSANRYRSPRSGEQVRLAFEESSLGRGQLGAVVAAREQVAIGIRRHLDRGVP